MSAAPAVAERVVREDSSSDVWSPDGPPGQWTKEGSVPNTDITDTVVAHRGEVVVVTTSYVNLRKRYSDEIALDGRLRVDDRRRPFQVVTSIDWRGRSAHVELYRWRAGDWAEADCDGEAADADFAANTVRVRVPRPCLGDPDWVRYQGQASSYAESSGLFLDSATGAGPESRSWTRKVRHG